MSALALAAAAALAPMLVVSVWNLQSAPRLHRRAPRTSGPSVSVLVPARDEAANLRVLLPALLASRYEPLEVVVLDDDSSDDTLAIARTFAARDRRLHVARGQGLPPGWLGKNWACHQLSRHATGEVIVFCDADVEPGADAVGRTIAAMETTGADVLTALPRDAGGGWIERGVVAVITKLPIAALLPLPLVSALSTPALSAGNGQWFAWRRRAYEGAGGHGGVRGDALEDVRLARRVKASGATLMAVTAPRDLSVNTYSSGATLREGFGKNLYLLLGGRGVTFLAGTALFVLAMWVPLVLPFLPGASGLDLLPLVMLVGVRAAAATLFGEDPISVALHPIAVPVAVALAAESWYRHRVGAVRWKRRSVATARAP